MTSPKATTNNQAYYAFVESRERIFQIPENTDNGIRNLLSNVDINYEVLMGIVEKQYFEEIENNFGVCDPKNEKHRKKRIENIKEYLSDGQNTYMTYIWCDESQGLGEILHNELLPSQWFHITLSKNEGYPLLRVSEEEIEDEVSQILRINKIETVSRELLERLTEIFSLNHIPDFGIEDENPDDSGTTPPKPKAPSPPKLKNPIAREKPKTVWSYVEQKNIYVSTDMNGVV